MTLIYVPKVRLPRKLKGYVRQFYQCKEPGCRRVFYRDYVPYSLANPIMWTPCGHSLGHRDYNMRPITEKMGRMLLAKEEIARKKSQQTTQSSRRSAPAAKPKAKASRSAARAR